MADIEEQPLASRWTWSGKLAIALFCIGLVVGIALFWMNKTPVSAGISITAIVLLMIYPIVHFIPSRTGREIAISLMIIMAIGFGWSIWPKPAPIPPPKMAPVVEQAPPVQRTPPPASRSASKPTPKIPDPTPTPQPSASAPNGIAISGGIVLNPTVNNGPAEAKISANATCTRVEPYQCEVIFTTDTELNSNIAFVLGFDQTLEPDYKVTTSAGPAAFVAGYATGDGSPNPNNIFRFTISPVPPAIPKDGQIYVTLHSKKPMVFIGARRGF